MSDLANVKPKARPVPAKDTPKFLKNREGRIFEATPELIAVARKHHLVPCDEAEVEAEEAKQKPAVNDDPDRDAAVADYAALFGSKPHYKWTIEKIREAIDAKAAE